MVTMTFRIPKFLRYFARNRSGASAIEFALLAPLMIGLYIGCVEISEGVAAYRKVTLTAGALANLTSQVTGISAVDKDNILQASIAIMEPYPRGCFRQSFMRENRRGRDCENRLGLCDIWRHRAGAR